MTVFAVLNSVNERKHHLHFITLLLNFCTQLFNFSGRWRLYLSFFFFHFLQDGGGKHCNDPNCKVKLMNMKHRQLRKKLPSSPSPIFLSLPYLPFSSPTFLPLPYLPFSPLPSFSSPTFFPLPYLPSPPYLPKILLPMYFNVQILCTKVKPLSILSNTEKFMMQGINIFHSTKNVLTLCAISVYANSSWPG